MGLSSADSWGGVWEYAKKHGPASLCHVHAADEGYSGLGASPPLCFRAPPSKGVEGPGSGPAVARDHQSSASLALPAWGPRAAHLEGPDRPPPRCWRLPRRQHFRLPGGKPLPSSQPRASPAPAAGAAEAALRRRVSGPGYSGGARAERPPGGSGAAAAGPEKPGRRVQGLCPALEVGTARGR